MPDPYAPLDEPTSSSSANPRRVAYFYDQDVGNYHYYLGHPMKPHRIRMSHNLIINYEIGTEVSEDAPEYGGEGSRMMNDDIVASAGGAMDDDVDMMNGDGPGSANNAVGGPSTGVLAFTDAEKRMTRTMLTGARGKAMQIFRPRRATKPDMTRFHTDEYINFLEQVTPEKADAMTGGNMRCLTGEDCPPFEGLWEFCSISAGGSIAAAHRLNSGAADIAINWAGGLHHAKKSEASGFCYVNDIVLGILDLLRIHQRVLYIDVDVHHGDGVEEAFYTTDRVMTASFHRFGDFFPGTGDVRDIGYGRGKNYSVNVPLRDGITDESYHSIFKPVIQHIMDWYQPGAIVLQMGADSLSGDKLGGFNMTLKGHGACASFVRSFGVPVMMLGGGGYTTKNVARAWANETAIMCGIELPSDLPYNQYMEYYGPRYKLEVLANNQDDHNPPEYLEAIKTKVIEQLRNLPSAPSVGMQSVPSHSIGAIYGLKEDDEAEDEVEERVRKYQRRRMFGGSGYSSGSDSEDYTPRPRSKLNRLPAKTQALSRARQLAAARNESALADGEDPCGGTSCGGRKKRTFFKTTGINKLNVLKGVGGGPALAGMGWGSLAASAAQTNGHSHANGAASPYGAGASGVAGAGAPSRGENGTPVPPANPRKKSFAVSAGGALIASGGEGIVAMAQEGLAEEEAAIGGPLAPGHTANRAVGLASGTNGDISRATSPMSTV